MRTKNLFGKYFEHFCSNVFIYYYYYLFFTINTNLNHSHRQSQLATDNHQQKLIVTATTPTRKHTHWQPHHDPPQDPPQNQQKPPGPTTPNHRWALG